MKRKWYRKHGWVHLPTSLEGLVIDLAALIFLITVFTAVDRNSHSVSDTLYGIFPYFVATVALVEWIASNTSH